MITVDMLERGNRVCAVVEFEAYLSDSGVRPSGYEYMQLSTQTQNEIYGPVVASNLEFMRQQETEPATALAAALTLSGLTRASAMHYRQDEYGLRPNMSESGLHAFEFASELATMQGRMAEGEAPYLLPAKFAMSKNEGTAQAIRADVFLTEAGTDVGVVLSDANYGLYFTPKVMATAADIPNTSIEEVIEADGVEKMPHLVRTNLAIGQIVGQLARDAKGNFTVIDIGSGTGATLASIFGELNGTHSFERTNVVAVEPSRDFARTLQDFAIKAGKQAVKANPEFGISISSNSDLVIAKPELQIVRKPISKVDLSNNVLPQGKDDIAVITANYSLHRLTSQDTAKLAKTLGESAQNVICLIADLMANGSEINRRHFNFGNNGPLNCGNLELQQALEAAGFVVRKVGEVAPPKPVHGALAEKIALEANNDGHMWIAFKGSEAERLVSAA